jgi:serine/threonine-protein kinase
MKCPHCGVELPGPESHVTQTIAESRTFAPSSGLAAWSAAAAPPGSTSMRPGAVLAGRYRIVNLAGRGAMGEVYRAEDMKLDQTVALKFLPQDLAEDPDRLARLLNEVRTARQVSHPNVCRVYDIGESEGRHFLTMEFIAGEDLASLLKSKGRLAEDEATAIARQLAAGLAAAHERGVLHRDLKPSNIMVDERGAFRITDFGLADASPAIVGRRAREGTPLYMAPEQLAGTEATQQSDLYALGLILYEIFTGARSPARARGSCCGNARPPRLPRRAWRQESTPRRIV